MKSLLKTLIFSFIFLLNTAISHADSKGLSISTLEAPMPVKTKNKQLLVYELHITNTGSDPRRVNRIEVRDDANKLLAAYNGTKLAQNSMVYEEKKIVPAKTIELKKNMGAFIYMWIALDKTQTAPKKLNHHIWSVSTNKDKSQAFIKKITYAVPVKQELPPLLSPPLEGDNWVAVAGINQNSYHRRTILPVNGEFHLAQRFAIDWERIHENGHESVGNMHDNKNWRSFGHKILAVADGTIVNVGNKVTKENTPPGLPEPPPPFDELSGNFVVLKMKQNNKEYYVHYAHMQPGSITVREGDKVHKGQILGLLGNTGNSASPHLHMHVMNGKDPLASEGLPFVFANLALQGVAKELDMDFGLYIPAWYKKIHKYKETMPAGSDIVNFDAMKTRATA